MPLRKRAAAFATDPTSTQHKVIPVRVRECAPRELLKPIVFIDLVGLNKDKAAEVLLRGVKAGRQKPDRPVRVQSARCFLSERS